MRAYERLIKYASYPTASDERSSSCPSTPEQLELGRALAEELRLMGVSSAEMDKNGYVYASIPANIPNWNGITIGFVAHMDVVDVVEWRNIRTRLVKNYNGQDIILNKEKGIIMSPKEYPELKRLRGMTLLVTDGTTLLGADDKAGVAEIMTMAEKMTLNPSFLHGDIKICFTPDEEIGRGADLFDVKRFGADFAYTVDGGGFGEVEYETFNAASAHVTVTGRSAHPGAAKGIMKNAARIAMEYDMLLPACERPENTEGYQGFFHLLDICGNVEKAELDYILRDHDEKILDRRKFDAIGAGVKLNCKYGQGTVKVEIQDNYRNMAPMIKPHWHLIETAFKAIRACGTEPRTMPVRGGTDGSRLSYMGLPCPNLCTGGYNVHGRMEYACVEQMDDCVKMLEYIASAYGQMTK